MYYCLIRKGINGFVNNELLSVIVKKFFNGVNKEEKLSRESIRGKFSKKVKGFVYIFSDGEVV